MGAYYYIKKYWRIVLLFGACIYLSFNLQRHQAEKVIYSDPEGYYMYLPAVFIYNGFENIPLISPEFDKFPGTDKIFTKYTYGVSLLEMPFFLLAHFYITITGGDATGYSYGYKVSIMFAAITYFMLSLILLYKVLRKYNSNFNSQLTLFIIFVGTNLYFYIFNAPGASHIYSFFLFTLIIYLTPRFLQSDKLKIKLVFALILGLITIIRPTNFIIALYPLFYKIESFNQFKERFKLLFLSLNNLIILIIGFIIPIIPQMFYWRYISGHWLYYSYEDEGFIYWNQPKIGKVLFGAWSGWLIYTPIAVFFIAGLVLMVRKNLQNSRAILLILCIAIYLFASWWCWWFGGSFGHRCFVEFYTILSIPFAYVLNRIFSLKVKVVKYTLILILSLCIYQNLGITYTYVPPWDGPNWTMNDYGEVLKNLIAFGYL